MLMFFEMVLVLLNLHDVMIWILPYEIWTAQNSSLMKVKSPEFK